MTDVTKPVHVVDGDTFWYAENIETRVYFGIVKNPHGVVFVRIISDNYDEVVSKVTEMGEILAISPLSDLLVGLKTANTDKVL